MSWRASFWYSFPTTKAYIQIKLDPNITTLQHKIDPEKLVDIAGNEWFKPLMEGDPDFLWVKDENTGDSGPGLPFAPLLV